MELSTICSGWADLKRGEALATVEEPTAQKNQKKRKVEPAAPSAPRLPAPSADDVSAPAASSVCLIDDMIVDLTILSVQFDDRILQDFLQLYNADPTDCFSMVRRMQRDLCNGTVRNATAYFRTTLNNLRRDLNL